MKVAAKIIFVKTSKHCVIEELYELWGFLYEMVLRGANPWISQKAIQSLFILL